MLTRSLNLPKLLKKNRSAFLFGPRGVGKTALSIEFLSTLKKTHIIDLLHFETYSRYQLHPELFRKEVISLIAKSSPSTVLTVLVDEVQKLPALLDEVHSLIESYKGRVRFLLTGSSARKLHRGGANLLAGRAITLKLHPLTSLELSLDLHKALLIGTLPAMYLSEDDPTPLLLAYVETYLKEEILQEALVRKADRFLRFLDVAGQMNGEPVNYLKVGQAAAVSNKTAEEYFSILEDTLLVFRVNGWSYSVRKQLRQSPKFYFFDCGLLNAIRGELHLAVKSKTYRIGKLFENFIVTELIRLNDYFETQYRFFYWRTNTGAEVDLVITRGHSDRPIAIEIKSDSVVALSDLRGLLSFQSENKNALLFCLCQTPHAYEVQDKSKNTIRVLPWEEGVREVLGVEA